MDLEDSEENLKNKDPEILTEGIGTVKATLQTYGWFILLGLIAFYLLYQKYKPTIDQWQEEKERNLYKKMDSGTALNRMEAMERSRQRMQAEMDEKARIFAEKEKEKEEKKREERLEDWKRHQEGRGYRNKTKANDLQPAGQPSSSSSKPQAKKPLRSDFNPLMGDAGGACYRPTRRGGASGGG